MLALNQAIFVRREFKIPEATLVIGRREVCNDSNAMRLIKRLRGYQNDLFTFLDKDGVPFENNHAERAIRPAVILRKNSYGNRSEQGADCQAVLMSIFRTLKQRGDDPIRTVISAAQST